MAAHTDQDVYDRLEHYYNPDDDVMYYQLTEEYNTLKSILE